MATLTSNLSSTPLAAAEISALWEEYEAATTPEALLVKDLDKFEMIVQAFEYEKGRRDIPTKRLPCSTIPSILPSPAPSRSRPSPRPNSSRPPRPSPH